MTLAADRVSRLQLAGSRLNPVDPIAPNAAAALLRGLEPFVWRVRQAVVDKELGFWVARRIDKTLHMAAADQNELHLTAEQMRAGVDVLPRTDVVGRAGQYVNVASRLGQIDRYSENLDSTGMSESVVQSLIQHFAVQHRRKSGEIIIPVQNVESRRGIAHQVIVDPVAPHEIVGPHPGEDVRQIVARKHALHVGGLLGHAHGLFGG